MSEKMPQLPSEGKKKMSKRKKLFFFLFMPIIVMILAVATYGGLLLNKVASVMDQSYEPIERDQIVERPVQKTEERNMSILLLGVDDSDVRGYQEGSRTDAIMVATLNQKEKSIKLLSIPRDSYVYIDEKDRYTKINHAHSYGGVTLTVKTVEELLDIPIDYYVKMNFNAFMEVVEAIGGVYVDVPYEVKELDSKDRLRKIHLKPGYQRLNGEEALAFVRTRKKDNDVERGKRQQEVIKAVMKKSMSLSSIPKYSSIIEAVGDNMATDIPFSEMKSFFDYIAAGTNLQLETNSLAGEDSYINGTYYYQLDDEELQTTIATLKQHLGLIPKNAVVTNPDDLDQDDTDEASTTHHESDSSSEQDRVDIHADTIGNGVSRGLK